jgi:hypothetical protein
MVAVFGESSWTLSAFGSDSGRHPEVEIELETSKEENLRAASEKEKRVSRSGR